MSTIKSLRQAGRLSEAYALAKDAYDADPHDVWKLRDLAWVVYDYAKRKAQSDKRAEFRRCIEQLGTLAFAEPEPVLAECVCWVVRGMMASCIRAKVTEWTYFDWMATVLERWTVARPSEVHSAILLAVLRVKNDWPGFVGFCRKWGLDGFGPEDYKGVTSEDGRKLLSLVERAYMAYAKGVLTRRDVGLMTEFVPRLAEMSAAHHEYIYLPYYHAKILIALGRRAEALAAVKPFARRKSTEFWVWELLGDAQEEDGRRLVLYARALTCRSKLEMTINLRENMARLLLRTGHAAEARAEVDVIVGVRNANRWSIPPSLTLLMREPSIVGVVASTGNATLYSSLAAGAEEMIFGRPLVKKEKPVVSATGQECDKVAYEGKLHVMEGGYGFVGKGSNSVYVPQWLVAMSGIGDGEMVVGEAEMKMDVKKQRMGRRAKTIKIKQE